MSGRRLAVLRSLRVRFVVVFAIVAIGSALATAVLAYRSASDSMLSRTQDAVVRDVGQRVRVYAPSLAYPPSQAALERFARDVAPAVRPASVTVVHGDRRASRPVPSARQPVPEDVRRAVAGGRSVVAQRITGTGGTPFLVVGTPVRFAEGRSSGVQVYTVVSLRPEADDARALARSLAGGIAVVALLAVVLALVAARGVLGPVRRLGAAVHRVADGRLDARLEVSGGDELAELSRTFNTMAAALEANVGELRHLEASSRRFVADVSHELRTPLSAMLAAVDSLDGGADSAAAARLLGDETTRLATLVNDLIEISRFDAGVAVLRTESVDVGSAIERTLRARGWNDAVELDLPDGLRAVLDPRRLDVVVANLVGNALQHGRPPVRVRLREAEAGLVVTVGDAGDGIPPDALERVFARFTRGDPARGRAGGGSGLGLAIAHENARLHGGTLEAASPVGGGAVFRLWLPPGAPRGDA